MRLILFLLLLSSSLLNAQNNYPKDYFGKPLEIPLILSGTFAELRSNHFHSGLDIKTQGRVGLKVLSAADGFVSRIKVSHYGYGKALYITHPNGYVTVYAHLLKFAPEIEAYIKKHQYKKETFEIELFPKAGELLVTKGNLVAYSGNTGGSGGPHLHFEIRNKEEHPINPMLFGINFKDSTPPFVNAIYAYPIGSGSHVEQTNSMQKLRLVPLHNGDYRVENIEAYGKIGFGISTNDRLDLAPNKNGVNNIQTFVNGKKHFELDFSKFSFSETRHLNRLIDYKIYKKKKQRVQKLFDDNNPLSLIKDDHQNGYLKVEDSTYSVFKIKVNDFNNNPTWITLSIKGSKKDSVLSKPEETTPYYIKSGQTTNLREGNIAVDIFKSTFYDDFYMNFEINNDTLTLHEDIIPTKKSIKVSYNIGHYSAEDKGKLYIARLLGWSKYPSYSSTKRKGDTLVTYTKTLGKFSLAMDTIAPSIKPLNFKDKSWLSKYRFLKIKIDDKPSGISNYRATVNGKWILMEYDYKTKTLTHDFNDGIITDTKNNLKLIVTDNVGNSSTFETVFYRK